MSVLGARLPRWVRVLVASVLASAVMLALAYGGFRFWLTHRTQPAPIAETWFVGVRYQRLVMSRPRPVVAHLVRIDLQESGIELVITPAEVSPEGEVRSATTSSFAAQQHVQLAINASYFWPFRNNHPLDYEPHVGDPVHVLGLTASRGTIYGKPRDGLATAYLSADSQVTFSPPAGKPWNAVTGMGFVVQNGAQAAFTPDDFTSVAYPRTLLSLDQTGRFMSLLVVDGKQPGYSEGLTLNEAAKLLIEHGAYSTIQLDGGGSATLVRESSAGTIEQVSTPANFRLPGWERSVATHLGVRARAVP